MGENEKTKVENEKGLRAERRRRPTCTHESAPMMDECLFRHGLVEEPEVIYQHRRVMEEEEEEEEEEEVREEEEETWYRRLPMDSDQERYGQYTNNEK